MLITIKDNIVWDTETNIQTEETIQWFKTEVQPLLEKAEPVLDLYNRPFSWVVIVDGVQVEKRRNYIHESTSWAMKNEIIIVTKI